MFSLITTPKNKTSNFLLKGVHFHEYAKKVDSVNALVQCFLTWGP